MALPFTGRGARDRAANGGEETGAVAQLGEHLLCKQGVVGSIPSSSTRQRAVPEMYRRQQSPEASGTECHLLLVY
jgi:hypothetical protein